MYTGGSGAGPKGPGTVKSKLKKFEHVWEGVKGLYSEVSKSNKFEYVVGDWGGGPSVVRSNVSWVMVT